jgi:hypothetical protein
VVGLLFVLGAVWGLITSRAQAPDDRWLVVVMCVLVLLAGVGLLVARPTTPEQVDRFLLGPRKDSTDQRGPDEWQA